MRYRNLKRREMGMKDVLLGGLGASYPGTLKDGDYDIVVMNHVLEHRHPSHRHVEYCLSSSENWRRLLHWCT